MQQESVRQNEWRDEWELIHFLIIIEIDLVNESTLSAASMWLSIEHTIFRRFDSFCESCCFTLMRVIGVGKEAMMIRLQDEETFKQLKSDEMIVEWLQCQKKRWKFN